jgi:hypothetical protein
MGFLLIPGIPFIFHSFFILRNSFVSIMGVSIGYIGKGKHQKSFPSEHRRSPRHPSA